MFGGRAYSDGGVRWSTSLVKKSSFLRGLWKIGARWAGKAGLGAGRSRLGLEVSAEKGPDLQKRAPPVNNGHNQ